ncbi:MAG: hypothetical protein ABFD46_02530 [Armatimonadota bacterium]
MADDRQKKYTETEERAKRALDEEADRVKVEQVVKDKELTEDEAWEIAQTEGAQEHFTPKEEEEEE